MTTQVAPYKQLHQVGQTMLKPPLHLPVKCKLIEALKGKEAWNLEH